MAITLKRASTSRSEIAAVGSSMMRTLAFCPSALAISTVCISATLRRRILRVTGRSASSRSKSRRASLCTARRSIHPGSREAGSWPSKMFSATVRSGIGINSWWIMAMPLRMASCGLRSTMGRPRSRISPESTRCRPASTFINVDLPAPFSPISACTSPGQSVSETSTSALTPVNDLLTFAPGGRKRRRWVDPVAYRAFHLIAVVASRQAPG